MSSAFRPPPSRDGGACNTTCYKRRAEGNFIKAVGVSWELSFLVVERYYSFVRVIFAANWHNNISRRFSISLGYWKLWYLLFKLSLHFTRFSCFLDFSKMGLTLIPRVTFVRWATALPHGTVGSLRPAFAPARLVGLTVKLSFAFTLNVWFPSRLREPLHTSVTLWARMLHLFLFEINLPLYVYVNNTDIKIYLRGAEAFCFSSDYTINSNFLESPAYSRWGVKRFLLNFPADWKLIT